MWLYSDYAYDPQIKFGPDDGGMVWFNGTKVEKHPLVRGQLLMPIHTMHHSSRLE